MNHILDTGQHAYCNKQRKLGTHHVYFLEKQQEELQKYTQLLFKAKERVAIIVQVELGLTAPKLTSDA